MALDFRYPSASRATKDMDLARSDDEAAATADFLAAQRSDLEDYFSFVIERVGTTGDGEVATRYHVLAEVAGRLRTLSERQPETYVSIRWQGEHGRQEIGDAAPNEALLQQLRALVFIQ